MKKERMNKTLLKILSAIIAVVLWFAITYTEDPVISQSLVGLKLKVGGESDLNAGGFAIVNKDSFPAINVVIRGSRSNVIAALGEISAEIDVSGIKKAGKNVVAVSYSYPSNRVILEKIKVKEITVETESVTSREIPVIAETVNREKNGDTLLKSVLKTETVTVKGAQSAVYEIAYAKVKIDASKITKTSQTEYAYEFYNEKDEVVREENIIGKSRETVLVENTVYDKVILPVKVVLGEDRRHNYGFSVKSMSTETVEVGMDEGINAEFIEAEILTQNDKGSFEAELVVPEGVYLPSENTKITVSGEIVPKKMQEIKVKVEPTNLSDGETVEIVPEELAVTVKTAEERVTLKATADLSELTEKEGQLTVKIEADGDAEIIGTYNVTVKQGE